MAIIPCVLLSTIFENNIKSVKLIVQAIIVLSVLKSIAVAITLVTFVIPTYAQNSSDIGLATFQETAQLFIDRKISQNVTAAVTLQSTSNQEMQIPSSLEQKIMDNGRVKAVIITNEERCVLGVREQSCIMINISRNDSEKGITAIQETAKNIGNQYIDELNSVFDTDAKFHSVFVHHNDDTTGTLGTSGDISGKGTVSAVYTMPKENTNTMYEKLSLILIPKVIRDSGGFYDVALDLSSEKNAKMTFAIIPLSDSTLYQLKIAVDYPHTADKISEINPSEFFNVEYLERSEYFSGGFYPLNSLFQVVIISEDPFKVTNVKGKILETKEVQGERVPTDIRQAGWVFSSTQGSMIDGKYLFGQEDRISSSELQFSLTEASDNTPSKENQLDELLIVVGIIAVAGLAAAYYMKGYKK